MFWFVLGIMDQYGMCSLQDLGSLLKFAKAKVARKDVVAGGLGVT